MKHKLSFLRYLFKGQKAMNDDQSMTRIKSIIPNDIDPLLFASWCATHIAITDFKTYNSFIEQIRMQK